MSWPNWRLRAQSSKRSPSLQMGHRWLQISGSPTTTFRFYNSLEWQNSGKPCTYGYSFIIARGYKSESTEGSDALGQVWEGSKHEAFVVLSMTVGKEYCEPRCPVFIGDFLWLLKSFPAWLSIYLPCPPRRLGWYSVAQSLKPLITWLVSLGWPAPMLNHAVSINYRGAHPADLIRLSCSN